MEEYLQYMKTLRSQMNDVEDQAAKITVEEQMQITTIQTMERDLDSTKSETKQLKVDAEKMTKAKGQICAQILEKQRKIASLESDSSSLTQTLDLIQQERLSLSAKLVEKSTFYTKVAEDISYKLQQQQDWVKFHMTKEMGEQKMEFFMFHFLDQGNCLSSDYGLRTYVLASCDDKPNILKAEDKIDEQMTETEGMNGINDHLVMGSVGNDARKILKAKLDSAKAKLDQFARMKSKLVMENSQKKESIDQVKCRANNFKAELLAMDVKNLEEEHKALLSDIAVETEYLQSLQDQIEKLKGISHVIKCACGQEYKVEVRSCA
ncbi:hypothetical protein JRO89_XSUnG0025700 [Xanthoceras sorbifolium]|uniref:Uncharacterized protein n=1 Tax=Xanthoceras sorbifolium TaxID=99658 RepID=A0ABQ8H060_9ROSI|nr:hypothetical protein JRO89_XSUnG0025700 [Xanthoceras sorbifolium]